MIFSICVLNLLFSVSICGLYGNFDISRVADPVSGNQDPCPTTPTNISSRAPPLQPGSSAAWLSDELLLVFGGYKGLVCSTGSWITSSVDTSIVYDFSDQEVRWYWRDEETKPPASYMSALHSIEGSLDAYLFGGYNAGYFNHVWKFHYSSNTWTIVRNSDCGGYDFGEKNIASSSTLPWCGGLGSTIMKNESFYVFGGIVSGAFGTNVLYEYQMENDLFIWQGGTTTIGSMGQVGSLGEFHADYAPVSRLQTTSWISGTFFYLFGGRCYQICCHYMEFCKDLWAFDLNSNEFGWVGGKLGRFVSEVSTVEEIGARDVSFMTQYEDTVFLFGGDASCCSPIHQSNELWMLDLQSHNFTFIEGDLGVWNVISPDPNNYPSSAGTSDKFRAYRPSTSIGVAMKAGYPWGDPYDGDLYMFRISNLFSCFGWNDSDSNVCSSHGKCIGNDLCNCYDGFYGENCSVCMCEGIFSNETNVCSGHGKCIDEVCTCDMLYNVVQNCSVRVPDYDAMIQQLYVMIISVNETSNLLIQETNNELQIELDHIYGWILNLNATQDNINEFFNQQFVNVAIQFNSTNQEIKILEDVITSLNVSLLSSFSETRITLINELLLLEESVEDLNITIFSNLNILQQNFFSILELLEYNLNESIYTVNRTLFYQISNVDKKIKNLEILLKEEMNMLNQSTWNEMIEVRKELTRINDTQNRRIDEEIESLRMMISQEINDINLNISSLGTNLSQKIYNLNQTLTRYIQYGLSDLDDKFKEELRLTSESVMYNISQEMAQKMNNLKSELTIGISKSNKSLNTRLTSEVALLSIEMSSKIASYNESITEILSLRLNELDDQITNLESEIISTILDMNETTNSRITQEIIKLETKISNDTSKLESDISSLENELETMVVNSNHSLSQRIDREINLFNTRLTQEIGNVSSTISSVKIDLQYEINQSNSSLICELERIDDKLSQDLSTLDERISQEVLVINSELSTLTEQIDATNKTLNERIDQDVLSIHDRIDEDVERMEELMESQNNDLNNTINQEIDQLHQENDMQLSQINTLSDKVLVLENRISSLENEVLELQASTRYLDNVTFDSNCGGIKSTDPLVCSGRGICVFVKGRTSSTGECFCEGSFWGSKCENELTKITDELIGVESESKESARVMVEMVVVNISILFGTVPLLFLILLMLLMCVVRGVCVSCIFCTCCCLVRTGCLKSRKKVDESVLDPDDFTMDSNESESYEDDVNDEEFEGEGSSSKDEEGSSSEDEDSS